MIEKIEPALSREEWAWLLRGEGEFGTDDSRARAASPATVIGTAALALYGQPFGFTLAQALVSIADRIEAPPMPSSTP